MFKDRLEAGHLLADKLKKYRNSDSIVLAVPRGGVPVASVIARELSLPMELVLTKKIGHPNNKEYAIGAASITDYFVIPHENIPEKYVEDELRKIRVRLHEMQQLFMGNKPPINVKGKVIILVDDGIATGNTLLGTVNVLRKQSPKKIVIAVPVASESAIKKLLGQVDEVVTNLIPKEFYGVGAFYENFDQIEDEEVLSYLYGYNKLSTSNFKNS